MIRHTNLFIAGIFILCGVFSCINQEDKYTGDYPVKPVSFTSVHLTDSFWAPKIKINRTVTIPSAFQKCKETGRFDNFALAGGILDTGEHQGDFPFDDTDVYKVIEGASYTLAVMYDPALDFYLDSLISLISAAQEDDGYIYTCRTNNCNRLRRWMGDQRWEKLNSHELYNFGHLIEAAVAHYQSTGKQSFLNVAVKAADLTDQVFGPGENQKHCPSGHPIVEMALVKLFRVTGEKRYLKLAQFFIDETGYGRDGHTLNPYSQDHEPVIEQDEAVGHAVRFGYLYSGITDIASITGNKEYKQTLSRVWENVVSKKLYITGGIGSRAWGEGFGPNYELPDFTCYCETCASIANIYWNYRMFLLNGEAKYIDVLERTLYNGFLSGVSLSGDLFFYDNPLASDGTHRREPWFGCACCPGNVTRFMASVPGYLYASKNNMIFVNLFAQSTAEIYMAKNSVTLIQETNYPWEGHVRIIVKTDEKRSFSLKIRIPGWSTDKPVPSDLYNFIEDETNSWSIKLNGHLITPPCSDGYAVIEQQWNKHDTVDLYLPLQVKRIQANARVQENMNRVALQRGPLVYCLEGNDFPGKMVHNLCLDKDPVFNTEFLADSLNGVVLIKTKGFGLFHSSSGEGINKKEVSLTAIPYYAWNNRSNNEMTVWIPVDEKAVRVQPEKSLASLSKPSSSTGWTPGLNDQFEPDSSADISKPFFYWWLKKGNDGWVQYDFPEETLVSSSKVYWLVKDHYDLSYRIPESWELFYYKKNKWMPVLNDTPYICNKDQYNEVKFFPVKTRSLRLKAKLQNDYSGGILEWIVD